MQRVTSLSVLMVLACATLLAPVASGTVGKWIGPIMRAPSMCAKEGGVAPPAFMNATRTCLQFHSHGSPIWAPQDTDTTKYGQVWKNGLAADAVYFIDRHGHTYPFDPSAGAPSDTTELLQRWILVIVKAVLSDGAVTRFTPVLYVPYKTIMSTLVNTQFEGVIFNAPPRPEGAEEYVWVKWAFGDDIPVTDPTTKYGTLLQGTFLNLFSPARDSSGTCHPALCPLDSGSESPACRYYAPFFGNGTSGSAITLNWDANMHGPADTELVPMITATRRQYMARYDNLYELMHPGVQFLPRKFVFIGHGTPRGVPQNFTGTLSRYVPADAC